MPGGPDWRCAPLHSYGLLAKYLPEFAHITRLMQADYYHRYTTDEHTLRAIENLDAIFNQPPPSLEPYPRSDDLYRRYGAAVSGRTHARYRKRAGRGLLRERRAARHGHLRPDRPAPLWLRPGVRSAGAAGICCSRTCRSAAASPTGRWRRRQPPWSATSRRSRCSPC